MLDAPAPAVALPARSGNATFPAPCGNVAFPAPSAPWLVGAVTLLALGLRLACVGESFFGDELFTLKVSGQADFSGMFADVRSKMEITPPLFFIVAWVFARVGDPFVSLRMVSVLSSSATVPLLYLLGRGTVGRRAGVVAGAFWAVSPMAIFYGVEARAYALMTMLVVVATLAMLRAVRVRDWRSWAGVALAFDGCMYTHYTSVFVLIGLAGWALATHRDQWRPLLVSLTVAALLFAPWLPSMLVDLASPYQKIFNVLLPIGPRVVCEQTVRALTQGPYLTISWVPVALVGAAGLLALGGLWSRCRAGIPATTWLLIVLALATPTGLVVQSLVGDDMYAARNTLSSLPAALLLLAGLLVSLPGIPAGVGLALALSGLVFGAARGLDPANRRPAYRRAAEFIDERARPGDRVIEVIWFRGPPADAIRVHLRTALPFRRVRVEKKLPRLMGCRGRSFVAVMNAPAPIIPGYRLLETRAWPGVWQCRVALYEPAR
jgi:uncharacterized membrane protein